MAELSDAMQEARDEFGQFAAHMQPPTVLLKKEEGPAALPTTAGHTPTPSLASAESMEMEREKRDADLPVDKVAAAPPFKWAKGEAKGEQKDEAQTGKGRAAEAAPNAAASSPELGGTGAGEPSRGPDWEPGTAQRAAAAAAAGQLETSGRLPSMAQPLQRSRGPLGEQGGQGASGTQRGHAGIEPSDHSARGRDRGAAPRQRIHIVPPNGGGWQPMGDNPAAVRYSSTVAQAEGNQPGIPHESHEEYPPLQPVQCPPSEAGSPGSGSDPDGSSQGQRSHRGFDVPVFAMGSDGQATRQGGDAAGGAYGYGHDGENLEVFGDVSECCREVSCVAEDGGQPQRGHHPLLPRGPEPDGGAPPVVDDYEPDAAKQHLAPHRCHDEASQTGPLAAGQVRGAGHETALGPECTTICNLRLSNPNNHCYTNALLLAFSWMAALTPQGIAMPHRDMGRFLRWLARPLQSQATRTVAVWTLKPGATCWHRGRIPTCSTMQPSFCSFLLLCWCQLMTIACVLASKSAM